MIIMGKRAKEISNIFIHASSAFPYGVGSIMMKSVKLKSRMASKTPLAVSMRKSGCIGEEPINNPFCEEEGAIPENSSNYCWIHGYGCVSGTGGVLR